MMYWAYQSHLSGLETDRASIAERQQEVQQANQKLTPVRESDEQIGDWESSRMATVDVLEQLYSAAPGTDRLYFKGLKLTPQAGEVFVKVIGNGHARDRDDVNELYEQLEAAGFRVRVKAINLLNRDPDYPFVFELDADLLRSEPAAAPVAAATTGTSLTTAE